MYRVILSNGVEFNCLTDQTILEAAKKHKIAIEHSCQTGRCGVCIAQVKQGQTRALRVEESLGVSDAQAKKILTCCRTAESDTYLDIQDLGEIGSIPIVTLPCKISSLEMIREDVVIVTLRLPPGTNFRYAEGQYIDLIYNGIKRSYSIANAPREDGKIELIIKKIDGGIMSDYLFNVAVLDDLMRIEGPKGTFSYREDESENIIFLATGTGIAPVKAMLPSIAARNLSTPKNIYVFWGARYASDIFLNTSMFEKSHKRVIALSRDSMEASYKGYVQGAVLRSGISLPDSTVYACGSDTMISAAADLLTKNGLSPKRFFSDAFVSSN